MNATTTMDRTRYEAFSEQLDPSNATLNAYVEVGSITLKTHALDRVDVEARLRDVDLRVWQEDGSVFVYAENAPSTDNGALRPEANILVTVPAYCPLFVEVVAGTVTVHDLSAAVRTHVITGTITLNNIHGRIHASTVTGSIEYGGQLVDDMHRFTTTTGSVRLALDRLPNARVYAWATTGRVHCDLALDQQRRGGYLSGDHVYGISGSGEGRVLAEVTTGSVHLSAAGSPA